MKHNYLKHLFTALLLLCVTAVTARDFEVGGISYNILSEENKTVEVTYRGRYSGEPSYEYTGNMVIPESVTYNGTTYCVTSIGYYAFYNCTGLTSITIPNSVTSIGEHAFSGCSALTSITIPNSVTSIGYGAFSGCTGLTSITIPNSVTSIGGYAFRDCTGLTSVEIPNSVISIREGAFAYCSGFTSITIPNSVTSIGGYAFRDCTRLTSIEIPNSVTSIGEYAFYDCTGLTSVVIGNSVTCIGNAAFFGCSGLKSVVIGNSVTSIGKDAFNDCTGLTSITIPNSVTSIGRYAFYCCTGLTSITIPNSVTSIGDYAFRGCEGLKTVYNFSNLTFSKGSEGNGDVAYYATKVINAPNAEIDGDFIWCNLNGVNTLAFYLGEVAELTLPADYNGENYVIGSDAFNGCTGLTSIEIGNSVTSIGSDAFNGCNNIEKLYIGSSVESIGDKAFAGCEKITEIKVALEKPIRGSADIFADAVYDNATLYIPNGTEQLYQKREPWNIFFYIVEIDFTEIDDVEAEGERVQTIYDLQGRKVEVPSEGLYIINGKKVMIK